RQGSRGPGAAASQGGRGLRAGMGGRPLMGPVDNTMASAENLTKALFLAPLAGLAAGFTRLFGSKKPPQGETKEAPHG
ncbi:MAG: hypothetical protein C4525_14370, partial [Desulfarculus sp.]